MSGLPIFHIPSAPVSHFMLFKSLQREVGVENELAVPQPAGGCYPPVPSNSEIRGGQKSSRAHTWMSWLGTRDGVFLEVQQPTCKGEDPDSVCLPEF